MFEYKITINHEPREFLFGKLASLVL